MVASTTQSRLQDCLNDVDFPASKQDLLDAAASHRGDDETVGALRGIPPETYNNLDQVLASVSIVDEGDAVRDTGKTAARRTHTKPGLAESAKDIDNENPIVDELGENRGS
jgi:Protein of unknown function (DUF2795)